MDFPCGSSGNGGGFCIWPEGADGSRSKEDALCKMN